MPAAGTDHFLIKIFPCNLEGRFEAVNIFMEFWASLLGQDSPNCKVNHIQIRRAWRPNLFTDLRIFSQVLLIIWGVLLLQGRPVLGRFTTELVSSYFLHCNKLYLLKLVQGQHYWLTLQFFSYGNPFTLSVIMASLTCELWWDCIISERLCDRYWLTFLMKKMLYIHIIMKP